MMRASLQVAASLTALLLFTAGSPLTAQQAGPARLVVPATDGTALATDLFLPPGEGPRPTLLIRTPYGSENKAFVAERFGPSGYAVVIQNVRGTGGSGGRFLPLLHEREDGLATLDWITRQPWSDGRVVLWGASYGGHCAFLLAASGHPALRAMAHYSGWADNRTFLYQDGAFRLLAHLPWFVTYGTGETPPAEAWPGIFRTTPLADYFAPLEPMMDSLLLPFPYDRVEIPVLHLTGFHDYVFPSTLEAYREIGSESEVEQRLLLGPWWHNQIWMDQTTAGDEDFGPRSRYGFDRVLDELELWFDRHLGRDSLSAVRPPPVEVFVMGMNEWRSAETWPPAGVRYETWYLGATGGGGGVLLREPPVRPGDRSFTYDPADPVPTVGGAVSHIFPHLLGVRDQAAVESRPDVLTYTSGPLERGLVVAGPIRAIVYAATDGRDTDFTAKLVEVRSDGYARIVEEGIVRGRHRTRGESPQDLEPGTVYAFEIDLDATALRIATGSRLRLEISSSNFPKYDRNPNTGVEAMQATEFRVARQMVFHGPQRPSRLILPIWPAAEDVPVRGDR